MIANTARKCAATCALKVQKGPEREKKPTSAKIAGPGWIEERNTRVYRLLVHSCFF